MNEYSREQRREGSALGGTPVARPSGPSRRVAGAESSKGIDPLKACWSLSSGRFLPWKNADQGLPWLQENSEIQTFM